MSSTPAYGQRRDDQWRGPKCPRHPHADAISQCKRCNRPTCPDCTIRTEVANVCPECLSANTEFRSYQVAQQRGRVRPRLARGATVTQGIIAVTTLVSLVAMFYHPLTQLLAFHPILAYLQPWRFLTVGLVHAGVLHLGLNMLSLYLFGPALERYLGSVRLLAVYLLSIIGGSVTVLVLGVFLPMAQGAWTVGASGGLFGLFAALLVIERLRGSDTRTLLIFLGINFAYGFMVSNVSWQGHLGGIIFGALTTWVIVTLARPKAGVTAQRQATTQYLAIAGVLVLQVALAWGTYAWAFGQF